MGLIKPQALILKWGIFGISEVCSKIPRTDAAWRTRLLFGIMA